MSRVGNRHLDNGIALKTEGKHVEALEELRLAAEDDPDDSECYHQIGLVCGFLGLFEESLENLQHAHRLDDLNITILNDLALTYAMLGMYDEAKAAFTQVLTLDPGNGIALKQISFF